MSDAEADLPPGTLVAGKLRVVRALGVGGMGAVYEVEHELTRHRRALKLLHPQFAINPHVVARFLREASAAGRIGSEHVVETFDAGVLETGEPYLVMELLRGQSLADLLEERGRFEEREAIAWLAQACDGLQAAHEAGIVHRDIKPDNLFLTSEGRIKLLDFGISKFDPVLTGERQLTGELTLGTPYYMAPEQTSKSSSVDHRADIYALGVVLYECVTGTRPFQAETYPELIVRIHLGDYPPASSISPTAALLDFVIARAMAKKPEDRFQSPAELGRALRDLLPATERASAPLAGTHPAAVVTVRAEPHGAAAVGAAKTELATGHARAGEPPAMPPARPEAAAPRAANAPAPPSGYEATLLSAASEPSPAPRKRRAWPWLSALGLGAVSAAVLATRSPEGDRTAASSTSALPTAASPAAPSVMPPLIATSAPAPSALPAETARRAMALPHSAALPPPTSSSRARQHDLVQDNPFQ